MILESLTINNFRVFKGIHEFSLSPMPRNGVTPPIILFGGLNGAGKTTTLTAIRLALYGRQSLGIGTTQKDYHQYLVDSIHHSKTTGIKANNASVNLMFSYATQGLINHYYVKRSWTAVESKVTETLKIYQDNQSIHNLSYDQAQGFLNELIPIGVSDLFFFDGEKIAELAEDTEGNALGESVKKLIGLDIIEKLIADITVFIRNQNKQRISEELKSKIIGLEQFLEVKEQLIEIEQIEYDAVKIQLVHDSKRIDQLTTNLNNQGGAWAETREKELEKLAVHKSEKHMLETQLRENISDCFPFFIAPDFIKHSLEQLDNEANLKRSKNIASVLSTHIDSLEKKLESIVDTVQYEAIKDEIHNEFSQLLSPVSSVELIHDVSDSLHSKIASIATEALEKRGPDAKNLANRIDALNQKIDDAGINIARAPEQDLLTLRIKELNEAQDAKTLLTIQVTQQKEKIKNYLREAINTTRQLEKLHEGIIESDESNRALDYAHKAKNALNIFAKQVVINKIKKIEAEFSQSFKNLARKDDININARIEPDTFTVRLLNDFGNEIPKQSLSAGERQIYAIAMLDALAKTSGRKLPIIIDTPLGRLDSKHRKKLIENYFPTASHQVIILSTDTEIDEKYLESLHDHISHTIMLEYKGKDSSSEIESGYFWKTNNEK